MANEDLKTPYTREEKFLAKTAGETGSAPASQFSRLELYLAKMAGRYVEVPSDTRNRVERYLKEITSGGLITEVTNPQPSERCLLIKGYFHTDEGDDPREVYLNGTMFYKPRPDSDAWVGCGTADDNARVNLLPVYAQARYYDGEFKVFIYTVEFDSGVITDVDVFAYNLKIYKFSGVFPM